MSRRTIFILLAAPILLSFWFIDTAFALEVESRYFKADVDTSVDIYRLLQKLDVEYSHHADILPSKKKENPQIMLEGLLDSLYLDVSDILDIHMYSLRINLNILPDKRALSDFLSRYSVKIDDMPSFYYYDNNTICISYEEMNAGMLAHETAHAIISHYFIVPPSAKVQEILCGYVEYSLTKRARPQR